MRESQAGAQQPGRDGPAGRRGRAASVDDTAQAEANLPWAGFGSGSALDVLALQRTVGNRATTRALAAGGPPGPTSTSAASRHPGAIHRKVFMGEAKTEKTKAGFFERRKGTGERNVGTMVASARSYYFENSAEMERYAQNQTERIGFVAKESAWIRLPSSLIVLGENHGDTTLADIVAATGTHRWRYEKEVDAPSALTEKSAVVREIAKLPKPGERSHTAESIVPKFWVGMMGLDGKVAEAVTAARAATAALEAGPEGRGRSAAAGGPAAPAPAGGGGAAEEAYAREAKELEYFWKSMAYAAEAATHGTGAQPLWTAQQAVFESSYKALKSGVPLFQTDFIEAIVAGTFSFLDYKASFRQASIDEQTSKAQREAFAAFEVVGGDQQAGGMNDNEEQRRSREEAEKMREFQMLERIKGARGTDLLFGIGDVHRYHLSALLEAEKIPAMSMNMKANARSLRSETLFIDDQKEKHPQ